MIMTYTKQTKASLLLLLDQRDNELKQKTEQQQVLSVLLVALVIAFLLSL